MLHFPYVKEDVHGARVRAVSRILGHYFMWAYREWELLFIEDTPKFF